MFSDIDKIKDAILYVQSTTVSAKRVRLASLCELPEATLLLSIMYRLSGQAIPAPYRGIETDNEDTWDIILGNLVYYCMEGDKDFKRYYTSLPFSWQVVVHAVLSKRILTSVGDSFFLESIHDLYSTDKIVSMVTLPTVVSSDFSTQFIRKGYAIGTKYPLKVLKVPKNIGTKHIKYFVNYGKKIITNARSKTSRKQLVEFSGHGRVGIIFTEHKVRGYKYKTTISPLFVGTIEDILSLYKGTPYTTNNIALGPLVKENVTLGSDSELGAFLKDNQNGNFLYMSSSGVHNISAEEEYLSLPCLDYILDDDYNPIGVVVEYEGVEYKLRFNVGSTDLVDGISGRYIRCKVKSIKGTIISMNYNSVVGKWSKLHDSCVCCGQIRTKHYRNGVCSSCVYRFMQNLQVGNLKAYTYNGEAFTLPLKHNDTMYQVVAEDGVVSYMHVGGQGILNLEE